MKRLIERVSKSLFFGILATGAVTASVFVLGGGSGSDTGLPLEVRTPLAWVLVWPGLIWNRILSEDASLVAVVLTNVGLFSAALFAVFSKQEKAGRLL